MQKIKKNIVNNLPKILVLSLLIIPVLAIGQGTPPATRDGLVPCVGGRECDFGQLMVLVDNVIKFVLFKMVIPIAAILFAYAGFTLVTAPGQEAITKAKNTFTDVVLGLAVAIAAYLIIKTLLSILGYDGSWIGL